MRNSITFHRNYYEEIKELEPLMQAEIYNAIAEYAFNENESVVSDHVKDVFDSIKIQLDTDLKVKKRFKTPTPEEVQNYCNERKNNISGSEFCDFYESKGWVVGKTKMKDWKAAVRTWESKRQTNEQSNKNNNRTTTNARYTTGSYGGKISSRTILAKQHSGKASQSSDGGNFTVDVEIIK